MAGKEAFRRFLDALNEGKDTEEMFLEAVQETVRRIGGSFMPFAEAELPFIIIALTMLEREMRALPYGCGGGGGQHDREHNDDIGAEESGGIRRKR